MTARGQGSRDLMLSAEVAALFRVDVKTVTRWARAGKLEHVVTPGGHRGWLPPEAERRYLARLCELIGEDPS